MKDEDYKPFYLNNILVIDEGYYVLNGFPLYFPNEDLYYEIHIKSNDSLKIIKSYVEDWIYIDLISTVELEIYTGEHIQECFSDGPSSYTYYSYREIEKTFKNEWKPKVKNLEVKFHKLLNQRLPAYITARSNVVQNFKCLYKEISPNNNNTDKAHTFLFASLYSFPGSDLASEAYLHSLINPSKELILFKDWKSDYLYLEAKYNSLVNIDLDNYVIVKNHVIDIYKNMFNHVLPSLKYNFEDVDEPKYTTLFTSLIKMLDKTEA
ncbi:hypothetical protein [Mucilaginibacter kameinonensis]|uniref:hypothetical protein n=1 Tax=Mucilaginibacter kameinonensis TaxID=452286 RepID=UPI000EF7C709|nr:hypothetical protein [Mucilaginibacter kameinonensis]